MADLQLPGPNHKEANCIPKELEPRPLCEVLLLGALFRRQELSLT